MKERASSFEIRRFLIFFLCIFIVAAGTDCMLLALEKPCTDTEEKSEDAVLAEVDGERITLEDFEPRMQSISGYDNSGSATQRDRNRKALESHLKTCLFAVAAKDGKLDQNETVRKRLEDAKRAILAVEYTKRLHSSKKSEVTNREIKTYYNAHKNEFSRPAMVRARHILIRVDPGAGPSEISAALKRAKKVKKELEDGADFTELVKIYSDDGGTKNQGGDLGFITENRTDQAFTDAVFSLKPGDLSEP
ncbi:MAG: peptidylprolyl isomerase, partial [Syntrophales bacterium]|nr:peptidylprolyl isomerase [Syntrophales bacterium]